MSNTDYIIIPYIFNKLLLNTSFIFCSDDVIPMVLYVVSIHDTGIFNSKGNYLTPYLSAFSHVNRSFI